MEKILQEVKCTAWAKFVSIYSKLSIHAEPTIQFSNRLTSSAGYAYYDKNHITISSKLYAIDPEQILNQTVPHELAHIVSGILFECYDHSEKWKAVMVAYGIPPDRCHTIGVVKSDNTVVNIWNIGQRVSFMHRDRSKKETVHTGIITKTNLKSIKVEVNGSLWAVSPSTPSLKRI